MSFAHSLDSLLAEEAVRRREFPVANDKVYLAHAAVCPLPACVAEAMASYLAAVGRGGQFEYLHAGAEAQARACAAALLGATPEEIAFVPSTSAGLSSIAAGLAWKAGDSVVIAAGDFPSNVYPWLRLQRAGVNVRSIPARGDGVVTQDDVIAHVDDSTRLVALSSVHYTTGAVLDVDAIGSYLAQRNILFCVDAIQSFGALPLSARHVDFLVADGHKWLLAPQGMGIMFVRKSRFSSLDPVLVGWKSVHDQRDFVRQELELAVSARRYEPGSLNAIGLVGLHAALSMLQHVGIGAIARRLAALRSVLVSGLRDRGFEVLGDARGAPSGIVSFLREGEDMQRLQRALDAKQIVVSLRHDPRGRACIRVAPHFYNTQAELERLLSEL
jgi:cysteine desulfurase / selenocysteine lyase